MSLKNIIAGGDLVQITYSLYNWQQPTQITLYFENELPVIGRFINHVCMHVLATMRSLHRKVNKTYYLVRYCFNADTQNT